MSTDPNDLGPRGTVVSTLTTAWAGLSTRARLAAIVAGGLLLVIACLAAVAGVHAF